MIYRIFSFSLLFVFLVNCKENQPQNPTEYSEDKFLEYSKQYNKELKLAEEQKIEAYVESSSINFSKIKDGFYMYSSSGFIENNAPMNGDRVEYTYSVKNLKNDLIYSSKEIGNKNIILGQTVIPIGIEYAIKNMQQGDSAVFILPSSLAYGLKGDGNKIKADQVLVFNLYLNKIIKK